MSEYFTKGVIINETTDTYNKTSVSNNNADYSSASIRYVAILPPRKSKIINESIRQIKSSIDNTIYIYPILYEKFTHRNLCIKIQMVEFISSFDTRYPDPNMPYHILKNIYSTMIGPAFCNSAFTTVSYHTKLPILNEEIKIRLPDVLTDRHWLILTVHHVHVKQKAAPNKSFLGVFYNDIMYA